MLETRSANLMELAAALPRDIGAADHRYQYIERQLKNREIGADAVIKSYAFCRLSGVWPVAVKPSSCRWIKAISTIPTKS